MADFKISLAQAVEMRAQKHREKTAFHKLIVPESISGISCDEFKREQERDEILKTIVDKIASGAIKHCKGGGSSKFVRKNELIHREFGTPEGKRYWQVVVPQRYRSQVVVGRENPTKYFCDKK